MPAKPPGRNRIPPPPPPPPPPPYPPSGAWRALLLHTGDRDAWRKRISGTGSNISSQ